MFFRKQQWINTQIKIQQLQFSLNTVVDLVEQGTPIDLVFLSDGGSDGFEIYILIYLLSDSIGIVTIVQSQSIFDNSGQCTGVKFIFGKKLIDLFQDLLSL